MNKNEEIFTIGDKTNNGTISKFKVDSNGIRVFFEEKPKNYHVSLNSIEHVKQPILKTDDGVDIYEGDEFWFVNTIDNYSYALNKDIAKKGSGNIKKVNGILDFSTESAAKEFILMNKPCLSITDVINSSYTIYKLKEIVKSKL